MLLLYKKFKVKATALQKLTAKVEALEAK